MTELEDKTSETICIELTFSKKTLLVVFPCRTPRNTNKHTFFEELSISLDYITNAYKNFIVTGDMNIDTLDDSMDTNSYLSDFCDTFSLKNLILRKLVLKQFLEHLQRLCLQIDQ